MTIRGKYFFDLCSVGRQSTRQMFSLDFCRSLKKRPQKSAIPFQEKQGWKICSLSVLARQYFFLILENICIVNNCACI